MVDVNPEIWSNPTLGAAANGKFLDVVEAQRNENKRATIEGRKPLKVTRINDHPNATVELELPSRDTGIRMGDGDVVESPVGVPQRPNPPAEVEVPEEESSPPEGAKKSVSKASKVSTGSKR